MFGIRQGPHAGLGARDQVASVAIDQKFVNTSGGMNATDFRWFRVYFDLGIREQDWRGLLKSDGE